MEIMDHRDIAIIGGDRRISYMAPIFLREGCRVTCFCTAPAGSDVTNSETLSEAPASAEPGKALSLREALTGAGTVVCGIPLEKNGFLYCEDRHRIPIRELQRCLRKRQKLFGGILSEDFRRHCEERSIECHDFMEDEPLTLFNAVCTAEGAILEALAHKECLLHQSRCLVLGYGRCGSLIAQRLLGLCAEVFVTADDPAQLALALTRGCKAFPLRDLPGVVSRFDYLFNTIPACYLGESCLPKVRRDSLIIDIASGQKGVDYEMAKDLSLQALFCPGLPGKYAARSCAERLVKYVLENLDRNQSWKGA